MAERSWRSGKAAAEEYRKAIAPYVELGRKTYPDARRRYLAGLPAGPPLMRLQLVRWNSWIQTGRQVDVSMSFNAQAANGSTATFNVRANGIGVPVAK